MRAQRGSKRLSLTSPLDGGGWVTALLDPCNPGNETVLLGQEAGWAPGPVWTGAGFGVHFLERTARKKSPIWYPDPPTNVHSGEASHLVYYVYRIDRQSPSVALPFVS
jgi:hypothetical protein